MSVYQQRWLDLGVSAKLVLSLHAASIALCNVVVLGCTVFPLECLLAGSLLLRVNVDREGEVVTVTSRNI